MITRDSSWSYTYHSIRQAYIVVSIIIDGCRNTGLNISGDRNCVSLRGCPIGGKFPIVRNKIDTTTQWDPCCIRTCLVLWDTIIYPKLIPV
ncbi:hypothetical protein [Eisenbergiella massiliensis]|uniref:hypothetical protein n=1 Tax=Eisenbergiella massiliensis TaxID=1720294 RepID=UPI0039913D03